MNKKTIFSVLVIGLVVAGAIYFLPTWLTPTQALGAGDEPLTGWAWSSNVGWLSLDGANYGVTLDSASGDISGHAWSSNIGWIDFNPAGPYPAGPNHGAKKEGNTVTGWIRALSPVSGTNAGGWDGWISMSGSNYGVTITQKTVSGQSYDQYGGFAWGGDVVGWLKFDPKIPPGQTNPPGCTYGSDCQCGETNYVGSCGGGGGNALTLTCDASPNEIDVGESVVVSALVNNPDANAHYDYTINWGDGSTQLGPVSRIGSAPLSANHTYTSSATVTVTCNAVNTDTSEPYTPATDTVLVNQLMCGNGMINNGEYCDGSNLNGSTVGDACPVGFTGTISGCGAQCTFQGCTPDWSLDVGYSDGGQVLAVNSHPSGAYGTPVNHVELSVSGGTPPAGTLIEFQDLVPRVGSSQACVDAVAQLKVNPALECAFFTAGGVDQNTVWQQCGNLTWPISNNPVNFSIRIPDTVDNPTLYQLTQCNTYSVYVGEQGNSSNNARIRLFYNPDNITQN